MHLAGRARPARPGRPRRGGACPAAPRRCPRPRRPRTWTRIVPGHSEAPMAANAAPPLTHDPGHGGEGLDVVDDGRQAPQAARRRVRRALLGLAPLALEGLEEDRLLAQQVGALDARTVTSRCRPVPMTSAPTKPAAAAALIAVSRTLRVAVASARMAMIASSAPMAKAAMARPSMTAKGLRSRSDLVGLARGIRPVAVGDDDSRRGRGRRGGPPFLGGRVAGPAAAAQAGGGDGRDRARRPEVPDGRPEAGERSPGSVAAPFALPGQEDRGPALRCLEDRDVGHASPRPGRGPAAQGRAEAGEIGRLGGPAGGDLARLARRSWPAVEAEVAVVGRGPVDRRVPGAGDLADPLQRRDRQVAVGGLGRLEDLEHPGGVVIVVLEDLVEGTHVEALEVRVRRVGYGPSRAPEGRFLAPLAIRLGRAPMDVEAALGVEAAHVDALDGAGLGALEAGLALERPVLVVEELEAAPELGRDVGSLLGVAGSSPWARRSGAGSGPCP